MSMKRNSAAFLALLLSSSLAVTPSASVLADTELNDAAAQAEASYDPAVPAEPEASVEEAAALPAPEETAVESAEAPEASQNPEEVSPEAETSEDKAPAEDAEDAGKASEKKAKTEKKSEAETSESAKKTAEEKAKSDDKKKAAEDRTKDSDTKEAAKDSTGNKDKKETAEDNTGSDAKEEKSADQEESTDTVKTSRTHSITVTTTNEAGTVSGMYSMEKAVATQQADGTYLVRMHQISANRNLMALTDSKEKATAHEIDWYQGGGEDGFWFVIPVASLDTPVQACFSSTERVAQGKTWGNVMTLTFDPASLADTDEADVTASEIRIDPAAGSEDPEPVPDPDPDPDKKDDPKDSEDSSKAPADGIYTGSAVTNALMFKVTGVTLTSKDGKMTAVVTLSGTGYDYLYVGTKEEAFAADPSSWSPAVPDKNGKYTYEIPVEALDTPLAVASRSAKYAAQGKGVDAWLDRTITIGSDTLIRIGDLPKEETPSDDPKPSDGKDPSGKDPADGKTTPSGEEKPSVPTVDPKPSAGSEASGTQKPVGNDGKAEQESRYESDLSGATAAVNSSTALKDGVYTPSSFSWSGGTGRVSISCDKVTVKGGKAFATIAFSSTKYGYVKASGNTYYPSVTGGSSVFTIPVELNRNQTIIGMTTAMSAPHEITYSIYIALPVPGTEAVDTSASASGMISSDNTTMDEEAPDIVGLEFESETELEHAEYFKLYNYENGITLLEIDMTKGTVRENEQKKNTDSDKKKEKKKAEKSKKSSAKKEKGPSPEEVTAELYKGNVIKYLIVPEKEEVPVGLEKDMIVVQLPAEHLYMAAETGFAYLKDLDAMSLVRSVNVKEKNCKDKTVAKALKEKKMVYGGKTEKPDFKTLVKEKTDLAVLPADLLQKPMESRNAKDTEKAFESLTERFAFLGIPAVIDRSADEESELAKAEWIKVYGALADRQEEAAAQFQKLTDGNH